MKKAPHFELSSGLSVDPALATFIDNEVLPGTGVAPDLFWAGLGRLVKKFGAERQRLLETREHLQRQVDNWYAERRGKLHDADAYESFLRGVGYIVSDRDHFTVDVARSDPEITGVAGPQLVVPVTNPRYAINAVNARWGSLYDALYGTDALGTTAPPGDYDPQRGRQVIEWVRGFLDRTVPLAEGNWGAALAMEVVDGMLSVQRDQAEATELEDPAQFFGYIGSPDRPGSVILRNHGLRIEIQVDREDPVGAADDAGISDVVLEAAVTVIVDFEDSVATVDAEDKIGAYRNWLGLMRGDLETEVAKDGREFIRRMEGDRSYTTPDGSVGALPGRSLMLVRNVGIHLTTEIVQDEAGKPVAEDLLDALVTVACALHDLKRPHPMNSKERLVYIVKPKLHGPEEADFTNRVLREVERILGLAENSVRVGIMDEERRTSANLGECIRRVSSRIAFINTGFLDRTGDEIHTSMEAGPMIRKDAMKAQPWIRAYEERNVAIGLRHGMRGRAQIGKGMWAKPDHMGAMLDEKIAHPESGANCAWVPSPSAATLHAIHYHFVDVAARQADLLNRAASPLEDLLKIPIADGAEWSDSERVEELRNNAQGILGYVVRWVDLGVGASKIPDIHGVALMEDRATCRISSQHMANWLRHRVTNEQEVESIMREMAVLVDSQNKDDPLYRPMAPEFDGPAFRAALALVLDGTRQPSGYTEPILTRARLERKRLDREDAA